MRSNHRTQRNMFTLAGWLFADMFLAMTMLFLIASTIGTYIPKNTNAPAPHLIGMNKIPITVSFSVDVNGLLNNDPIIVAQVKSLVQNQLKSYLSNHINGKAAFVSTFGGGTDDEKDTMEARNVNAILQELGKQQHYVFDRNDTVYNQYIDRSVNFGNITIYIFFYLYIN